jgi:hypothetical protein
MKSVISLLSTRNCPSVMVAITDADLCEQETLGGAASMQQKGTCLAHAPTSLKIDTMSVTHIGRVDFRSDERLFGIKNEDRSFHIYIIGNTGTGKSTLIERMATQDLEHGRGFALIDPHGDLVERVAQRVKAQRANNPRGLVARGGALPHQECYWRTFRR